MPLYKCQKCDHTFTDKYKPIRCPDCGREVLRDATPAEYSSFFTPLIRACREKYSPSMTRDERNWTLILIHMNPPQGGYGWRFLVTAYLMEDGSNHGVGDSGGLDRESILYHRRSIYRDERLLFNRQLKQDRGLLKALDITEPRFILRKDDGSPAVADWDKYGPALRLLYSFDMDDEHKRPTLWDVNHIDLEKITTEPSEAYQAFLKAWADLFVDETHPMEGMMPKMNPFRVVDEHFIPDDDLPF